LYTIYIFSDVQQKPRMSILFYFFTFPLLFFFFLLDQKVVE
jgi:hypothetical protein